MMYGCVRASYLRINIPIRIARAYSTPFQIFRQRLKRFIARLRRLARRNGVTLFIRSDTGTTIIMRVRRVSRYAFICISQPTRCRSVGGPNDFRRLCLSLFIDLRKLNLCVYDSLPIMTRSRDVTTVTGRISRSSRFKLSCAVLRVKINAKNGTKTRTERVPTIALLRVGQLQKTSWTYPNVTPVITIHLGVRVRGTSIFRRTKRIRITTIVACRGRVRWPAKRMDAMAGSGFLLKTF